MFSFITLSTFYVLLNDKHYINILLELPYLIITQLNDIKMMFVCICDTLPCCAWQIYLSETREGSVWVLTVQYECSLV